MSGYERRRLTWKVWAALAALYVLWGSNFLAIRYAAEAMPPFLMMGARCAIAGALLFGWAWLREGARPTAAEWRSSAAVGVVLFLGCHGLLAWAEQTVPSGVAALVLATIPVWLTLLDWAAGGARPGGNAIAGLTLGLGGLAFLIGPTTGRARRRWRSSCWWRARSPGLPARSCRAVSRCRGVSSSRAACSSSAAASRWASSACCSARRAAWTRAPWSRARWAASRT